MSAPDCTAGDLTTLEAGDMAINNVSLVVDELVGFGIGDEEVGTLASGATYSIRGSGILAGPTPLL